MNKARTAWKLQILDGVGVGTRGGDRFMLSNRSKDFRALGSDIPGFWTTTHERN